MNSYDKKRARYEYILELCHQYMEVPDIAKDTCVSVTVASTDCHVLCSSGYLKRQRCTGGHGGHYLTYQTIKKGITDSDWEALLNVASAMRAARLSKDKEAMRKFISDNAEPIVVVVAEKKPAKQEVNHNPHARVIHERHPTRALRTFKHPGIGSSFGLVGW